MLSLVGQLTILYYKLQYKESIFSYFHILASYHLTLYSNYIQTQESRTSSLSNETMILFSHLWEGVQHVCPDRIGINIFVSNSTLRCNSDGDHMTFRTILTTKEPQNSSKSLLSCIEQWIDTVGTVIVQNLSLRIVQQCPLLISSFDTPMCIVLRSSDIPECTSQPKSQVSASPPWLLITIVLASFLCFLLAASTVLNITLSSYTIKYKK